MAEFKSYIFNLFYILYIILDIRLNIEQIKPLLIFSDFVMILDKFI